MFWLRNKKIIFLVELLTRGLTHPLKTRNYVWSYENNFLGIKDGGRINSLPTEFRLLITFANSLDPDQARQNVGPDPNQNCLTH